MKNSTGFKNELMVVYGKDEHGNGNWIYFPTNADTVAEAYDEYVSTAENAGINMDNMLYPSRMELRPYEGTNHTSKSSSPVQCH